MVYADSFLRVNLSAISQNYRYLKQQFTGSRCAGVVKSNAYGLGVEPVSQALWDAGCEAFFVANINEAITLRKQLAQAHIYVFHGVSAQQESSFVEYNIIPVLNTLEQVRRWQLYARKADQLLPAVLHVDTGMNRLGVCLSEVSDLLSADGQIEGLALQFVMSHLACADEAEHPLNEEQLRDLNEIHRLWPSLPLSFVNSYGVFLPKSYHFDIARPGMALYGMNPTPALENPMQAVVEWSTSILQVREIDTYQSVGYGATCELDKGSVIAVVPVGYADGFFRHLGNTGFCWVEGHKVPVVGRVSMDLITLDITAVPSSCHFVGQKVEILGPNQTVDSFASGAGTIGYEVITGLGQRLEKQYHRV